MIKQEGKRFNEGKQRWDLLHPIAQQGLVKVLTSGANKYGDKNWEKGMVWSKVIASLKRHLAAIERGEDYDLESGELHADHLQANTHFLSAYYSIYPQGDDRQHAYLNHPKIGLDIDEVICSWTKAWTEKFGYPIPQNWHFSYNNKDHFESFSSDELNEFYLNIPPLITSQDIPFEPHCYVTSRSVPVELTKQWIQSHGFPTRPVYSVGWNESKIDAIKASDCEVFVDDRFENFTELNKAGICTYLLSAPHNARYNVGHKRINSLKDLPWFK
jgi:hypothetical protein